LIANISNNGNEEDYSNLKQIIKESIKTVITENKKLISVSFTAIIQTLKDDLQMVNLIYNVHTTNDSEQLKDNNNSITQYVESNKDSLLYLTEKNYENLLEKLTNNAIDTALTSSFNPTSSLPLPSSTFFLDPYNQSDTYRIEKSESFHHSKGDIAE
jgi:F0F1-type ATP synthase gamma subunit